MREDLIPVAGGPVANAYRSGVLGHIVRNGVSPIVAGTLIAFAVLALAGVILVQAGPESSSRLGLLFGTIGVGAVAIAATLKADQAASQTNGKLDDRIEVAVKKAMAGRWLDRRIEQAVDASMARRSATNPQDRSDDV